MRDVRFQGAFYESSVASYLPTSSHFYALSTVGDAGLKIYAAAPAFPKIDDYVDSIYTFDNVTKFYVDRTLYLNAAQDWYNQVDALVTSHADFADLGGLVGVITADFSMVVGAITAGGIMTGNNMLHIIGSNFVDKLEGGAGKDTIEGGLGGDTILGGNEDDILWGDIDGGPAGADTDNLSGGEGNDKLNGQAGDDWLYDIAEGGRNTIDGGTGYDRLYYGFDINGTGNTAGVTINGGAGINTAIGDTVHGVEFIAATDFNDDLRLAPSAGAGVTAYGRNGNDFIVGTVAADFLYGGNILSNNANDGTDHVWGYLGSDVLHGGGGDDFLYGGKDGHLALTSDDAANQLFGDNGKDILYAWTQQTGLQDVLDGGKDVDEYFVDGKDKIVTLELQEKFSYYGQYDIGRTIVLADDNGTSFNFFQGSGTGGRFAQLLVGNRIDPDLVGSTVGSNADGRLIRFEYGTDLRQVTEARMAAAMRELAIEQRKEYVYWAAVKDIAIGNLVNLGASALVDRAITSYLIANPGVSALERSILNSDEFKKRAGEAYGQILEKVLTDNPILADDPFWDGVANTLKVLIAPFGWAQKTVAVGEGIVKLFFTHLLLEQEIENSKIFDRAPDSKEFLRKPGVDYTPPNVTHETPTGKTSTVGTADGIKASLGGGGIDSVYTNVNIVMPSSVEKTFVIDPNNTNLARKVTGNTLNNVIAGNDGADTLSGMGGSDTIAGGAGNDVLVGGVDADALNGGIGVDTVSYSNASARVVAQLLTPANNQGDATGDTYDSIESIVGSRFDDGLVGSASANKLDGGAGADRIFGVDGNDVLIGGAGADYLSGGAGTDTASYANASARVVVQLLTPANNQGDAAGDTFNSIESIIGSRFDDGLVGSAGANNLDGGAGADRIFGIEGNDVLTGGAGADYLSGGLGTDTASYAKATTAVTVSLANPAVNRGDAAGDTFNSIENLIGSGFGDILNGSSAGNVIDGGAGNDALKGYAGNDRLTGHDGADIFIFNTALNATSNVDTITDFSVADDTIQLDDVIFSKLAVSGTLPSGYFRANAAGTAQDANDYILYETDTGKLFYDADGNKAGGVAGVHFATISAGLALTSADFAVI